MLDARDDGVLPDEIVQDGGAVVVDGDGFGAMAGQVTGNQAAQVFSSPGDQNDFVFDSVGFRHVASPKK